MPTEEEIKAMTTEELFEAYENYNSTASNPLAAVTAKRIRAELESRGESVL